MKAVKMKPIQMIVVAVAFLFSSFIISFLMVLRVLEPNLILSFLTVFCSVIGLGLGYAGISQYVSKSHS